MRLHCTMAVLGLGLTAAIHATTITGALVDTSPTLIVGADPFFWAGSQILVISQADNPTPGVCGVDCANYPLTALTLTVASTYSFAASNPLLTVNFNPSGDSMLQFSGLATVSSFVFQFDLAVTLPQSVLDSSSLTHVPQFPLTAINPSASLFLYGVVNPPQNATFGILAPTDGFAASTGTVPEPNTAALLIAGIAVAGFVKKTRGKSSSTQF
jgi:hypothetical protein